jgi:hypothetical protein
MLGSIRARLIVFSAIPLLLFLIIGVLVVVGLARGVQRQEFVDTLEVELFQLVAWAQVKISPRFPKKPIAGTSALSDRPVSS